MEAIQDVSDCWVLKASMNSMMKSPDDRQTPIVIAWRRKAELRTTQLTPTSLVGVIHFSKSPSSVRCNLRGSTGSADFIVKIKIFRSCLLNILLMLRHHPHFSGSWWTVKLAPIWKSSEQSRKETTNAISLIEYMNEWMNQSINQSINEGMNESMKEWIKKWMKEWRNE